MFQSGGLAGTRTQDQRLKRPLLYRLSYQPNPAKESRSRHPTGVMTQRGMRWAGPEALRNVIEKAEWRKTFKRSKQSTNPIKNFRLFPFLSMPHYSKRKPMNHRLL